MDTKKIIVYTLQFKTDGIHFLFLLKLSSSTVEEGVALGLWL